MKTYVQIEWDELQSTTKGLFHNPYNSRCNTPLESKKVDLQPSPSPPPVVPPPKILDNGFPQASTSDGVLVKFMGNNNYHDIAVQAASELLPPEEEVPPPDREEDVVKKKKKKKDKDKDKNKNRNRKKKEKKKTKKDKEATRKEEHKNEKKDKVATTAQANRQGPRKATANTDHNTSSEFHALEAFPNKPNTGLLASTALVQTSFEISQDALVLSTHQLQIHQGLLLSSIEEEQIAVYQKAMEGMLDRNGKHIIILTTLPNIDQWTISAIEVVNNAQEFIKTKVKEGIITLRLRNEDEMGQNFKELTWEDMWDLIEDEVKDEVADEVVDEVGNEANEGNKMRREQLEHLEPNCPDQKETTRQWHLAIQRHPALTHLWTALYNLLFRSNRPQPSLSKKCKRKAEGLPNNLLEPSRDSKRLKGPSG